MYIDLCIRGELLKVSVALAAYNGEKYIEEQIESILCQLSEEDEIIVSDDNPGSSMSGLVKKMAEKDPRIKYTEGPGRGVIKNFENAISKTSGDIIFLADQDDIWLPGKVEAVKHEIMNGAVLVLHDAKITDSELNVLENSFFKVNGSAAGYIKNIIKNSYMGCCMAFDKSLKESILPFPDRIPMHDQYIGLVAEKLSRNSSCKVKLLNTPYILHRVHGENVTGGSTSLKQKITWRWEIIRATMSWRKQFGR